MLEGLAVPPQVTLQTGGHWRLLLLVVVPMLLVGLVLGAVEVEGLAPLHDGVVVVVEDGLLRPAPPSSEAADQPHGPHLGERGLLGGVGGGHVLDARVPVPAAPVGVP